MGPTGFGDLWSFFCADTRGGAGPAPFFTESVRYVVFVVLQLGERSLLRPPLAKRRKFLHEHVVNLPFVELCGAMGNDVSFLHFATSQRHEGVVAKKLTSRYLPN